MEKVIIGESNYPDILNQIEKAPNSLYFMGDVSLLGKKAIAVVGSRNMSEYGKKMTKEIVKELSLAGYVIVSGLAIGIDSVAHRTCIENGGKTIAVLGSGLNQVFPSENKDLFNKIIENGGCVISEYEPDVVAEKRFFPERNRIVSGLSLATLVIEATYRSGTSITAKYALKQGRRLFCLPNSVGNKNSCGIINMLKNGAEIVTSADDILYKLGAINKEVNIEKLIEQEKLKKVELIEKVELEHLDENAKKIYFYIKEKVVVSSENICNNLKISINKVNVYLSLLELKGLIVSSEGVNFRLSEELCV